MISNPLLHDPVVRTRHILLCVLLGLAYGFSMGISLDFSVLEMTVDAVACIPLFFTEAIMLWSIFTFSRLEVLNNYQSLSIHIAYVIFAVVLMLACEWFILYSIVPNDMPKFVQSLPIRIFTLFILYTSFRKYYELSNTTDNDIQNEEDETFHDAPSQNNDIITRITVKTGNKIKVIPVEDIIFIKAEDDYANIFTTEGHWLKSERLKDYETSLPLNMFARIHRSYIVNLTKISKIERYGQKQLLFMNNGEQIRISITGYKVLKEKLNL